MNSYQNKKEEAYMDSVKDVENMLQVSKGQVYMLKKRMLFIYSFQLFTSK